MNTQVQKVSKNQIIDILASVKGCKFVSVEYATELDNKMLKRNNPHAKQGYLNHCSGVVQLNYSYQNAVNNRLEKVGEVANFIAEPMKGFSWVTDAQNKLMESKKGIALRLYKTKLNTIKSVFSDANLQPLSTELVEGIKNFIPSKKENQSQKQAAAGLMDPNQVTPFSLYIDTLLSIKLDGIKYEIVK